MSVASLNHSGWNISLFERRKFRRFPWGQHSKMTHSFPPLVQAPSKFTIFLCSPKWIRIFSSEAKSLYSVSAASSKEIIFIRIGKSVTVWAWTTKSEIKLFGRTKKKKIKKKVTRMMTKFCQDKILYRTKKINIYLPLSVFTATIVFSNSKSSFACFLYLMFTVWYLRFFRKDFLLLAAEALLSRGLKPRRIQERIFSHKDHYKSCLYFIHIQLH